jgi:Big-like domain-containing protein/putative pyrroloquinoline-quinone binding quinoprotein
MVSMKQSLLTLFGACGLLFLGAEAWAWQTSVSGTAGGGVFNATAIDGAGNVVAAGSITNTDTGQDFTVVKLDGANGAELWRQELKVSPGGPSGAASAVAVDAAGNVVAAGSIPKPGYGKQFAVVKLDGASGAELWRQTLGGTGSGAKAVALDGIGNVVAAGVIVEEGMGPDFAVVKFDGASGTELWRRVINGTLSGSVDQANAVAVDAVGNVVAAGFTSNSGSTEQDFTVVKLDGVSGIELWREIIPTGASNAVAIDSMGNVVAAGQLTNDPGPSFEAYGDMVIVKFNGAIGAELWRKVINGPISDTDNAFAVTVDGDGNAVAAGVTNQTTHSLFTAVKVSGSTGAELWRKIVTGSGGLGSGGSASSVTVDSGGNVIAGGHIESATSSSPGVFAVIKLEKTSGNELWRMVIDPPPPPAPPPGHAHAVRVDGTGNVIAAGTVSNLATVAKLRGTDGGDFVPDTEPPTVAMTAPANGAIVSGTITVSAEASDNVGVAGVQFYVDGAPLGAEDTEAPYAVTWDTSTTGIGQHSLSAVARDAAGNSRTSAPVTVTVVNVPRLPLPRPPLLP